MTDFDDAIGDMCADLLLECGVSCVYSRGTTDTTVTMEKSSMPPMYVDSGTGSVIEVQPVDFTALTVSLPYDPPLRGDRIAVNGLTYEVQPTTGEKVFRRISPQVTRIHTKQIG